MFSTFFLAVFGSVALLLLCAFVFFPWALVSRWRTRRILLAPEASPAVLEPGEADARVARRIALDARETFVQAQRALARGPRDLYWLGHTTWWAVQVGVLVALAVGLGEAGFAEAASIGALSGGVAAVVFALGGLYLTLASRPGLVDGANTMGGVLQAVAELNRAQAMLHHLGEEERDLVAFRHPLQGASFLWVLVPRPFYSLFVSFGIRAQLARWEAVATDLASRAEALGSARRDTAAA